MSSRPRNDEREPDPVGNGDVRRSKRVRERPQYFVEEPEELDDDDDERPSVKQNRKFKNQNDSDFIANSGSEEEDSKKKKKKDPRKGPNAKKRTKYNDDSDASFNASSSSESSSGIEFLHLSLIYRPSSNKFSSINDVTVFFSNKTLGMSSLNPFTGTCYDYQYDQNVRENLVTF